MVSLRGLARDAACRYMRETDKEECEKICNIDNDLKGADLRFG